MLTRNQKKIKIDVVVYLRNLLDQYDFSVVEDNSLFSGNGSKLLVLHELYKYSPCVQNKLNIKLFANSIRENIDKNNDLSFGGGLFGNLYLLLYLNRKNLINSDNTLKYKYLLLANDYNENCFNENNYDLQTGFIGTGIYALECLNNNIDSRFIINNIIDWLSKNYCSKNSEEGIFWNYYLQGENGLSVSIGLLHGITSILTFLSISFKYVNNEYQKKIDFLLSRGLKYLVSIKQTNEQNYFPIAIDLNEKNRFKNTYLTPTYCTSELGIYFGLNTINQNTNNTSLNNELKYIDKYIFDSIDFLEYSDPFFCHGTAGILYYYVIKQNNSDPIYSTDMISRLIYRIERQVYDPKNIKLLSGSTGVMLTILKYINFTYDTAWERALLLN